MKNKKFHGLFEAYNSIYTNLSESHYKVGDEVICKDSGMEGKVVKVDQEEKGKYYTVEREDGKKVKYAPDELKKEKEGVKEEKMGVHESNGPVEMEKDPGYKMTYAQRQKALKDKAEKIRKTRKEEYVDEAMSSYEKNRKRAAQRAAARNEARKQGKTGAVPGVGYVSPRPERETWTDEGGRERHKSGARMPQKESYDLFDTILEHLVSEGYADTNEAALVIMANMSEEWRQSIIEQSPIAARAAKVVDAQRKGFHGDSDEITRLQRATDRSVKKATSSPMPGGV